MKVHFVGRELFFPDPRKIQFEPEPGLVAVGGDLSVERLVLAYRSGIFPWTDDPVTWWSPPVRAIFEFDRVHIGRTLQRIVRDSVVLGSDQPLGTAPRDRFEITLDRAFPEVIRQCATSRKVGNWITESFIAAYVDLHRAGHAHSLEVWQGGELVGGIYGVAQGGLFAGESMFHRTSNASKVALCFLLQHVRERGFTLFDIQVMTPTTEKFGAVEISRDDYLRRLEQALREDVSFL